MKWDWEMEMIFNHRQLICTADHVVLAVWSSLGRSWSYCCLHWAYSTLALESGRRKDSGNCIRSN